MSTSSVRVGIRIRPLVTKEKGQSLIIDSHDNESIVFKGQTFTFDHVFGSDMSQMELYERTAASMLKNVLEGYNCTIIAYGQTGSGKTFTMGTSDVNICDIGSLGLIPRFVNDLFQNLNDPEDQQITYKVKASFLEIYGEDVYDLLSGHGSGNGSMMARSSLAVREDEHGHVFVQGQIEQDVIDPESALEALSMGSSNRITASTAMNAGSSRSHAVFTLSITQYVKSGEDDLVQNMSSKLTFVDLAGSERIKRTGAEGQRMKEGIQINSGLFNLGQVINSLADEQKLKNGVKPAFVPYRNSKLTHLLKDALGGNSQTLFLACISPAESNESETYSTLSYARQARNIQNKPVKNMDETQTELRRLKLGMRTWMLKAVKLAFGAAGSGAGPFGNDNLPPSASKANGMFSPGAATLLSQISSSNTVSNSIISEDDDSLLQRPEVIEFIEAINNSIKEKVHSISPSPRKVRLSLGVNPTTFHNHKSQANHLLLLSPSRQHSGHHPAASAFTSPRRNNRLSVLRRVDTPGGSNNWMLPAFAAEHNTANNNDSSSGRESILFGLDLSSALEAAGNNVSDSQVLIERMMDVISEEKRILGQQLAHKETNSNVNNSIINTNCGNNNANNNGESFDFETCVTMEGEDNEDEEELKVVDKLITEKEEILNKLMENIKGYSALKMEFEKLVDAINGLELEKKELEMELEKAKKSNQSSAQLEKIKERFTTVKEELRKMKEDRKTKEQAYKMMQKESKTLENMQRELQKLKENKVSLMKQSKSQFNELQKIKKEQAVKMQLLKKNDVKKQQQMNALKSELVKKERIIGHRDKEIGRMAMKLKASEDHITQLLKIQNRNRQTNANNSTNNNNNNASNSNGIYKNSNISVSSRNLLRINNHNAANSINGLVYLDIGESEHLQTSKAVIDQAVLSQVEKRVCRLLYEKKTLMLKKLNLAMSTEASDLEALLVAKQALLDEHNNNTANDNSDNNTVEEVVSLPPEKRVLLESYEQNIKLAEAKIERLTKEIDLFNADIDDLSLQLEKIEKSSDNNIANIWDTIGNEVVLGLSASQAQTLVLDLLTEKTTLSTSLRTSEAEIAQLLHKLEDETAMKLLLAKHVEELRVIHRNRLVELEKQRLEDVWAMMKANNNTNNHSINNTVKGVASEVEAEAVQKSVLFQKTLSLEQTLEEKSALLQETQSQLTVIQKELNEKCNAVSQLEMQLQVYARVNAVANAENQAQGGNVSGFLDAGYLQKLQQLWEETGCAMEERHMVMDCLLKSQELAKERAMSDAERALKAACEDYGAKENVVRKLISVIGESVVAEIKSFHAPEWSRLQMMPKIHAVKALEMIEKQLREKFEQLWPEIKSLREQLDYYVAEMWLEKEDLSLPLQRLSVLPSTTNDNTNNVVSTNDKHLWMNNIILEELATNGISLSLEMPRWQEELKTLNLSRVRVTASLIALREQCLDICADLDFVSSSTTTTSEAEKQELSLLLAQVFSEDAEVTSRARNAVVQILTQQTSSNPPGAQALLIAFDKLKLLLESVRLNRSTVTSLLKKVQDKFFSDFVVLATAPQDTAGTQCGKQMIETLTERLLSLPKGLWSIKQRLMDEVSDVLAQISGEKLTFAQLQPYITKNVDLFTTETDAVLQVMADSEEELQGMEMFVEEHWLQVRIQQILKLLQQRDAEAMFSLSRDILYLAMEKKRLEALKDTMSELQRTDVLLTKHMTELEEFEERSKADRVKALTGNSKMLIEEEKFRKNGKKKYETISEKMLQLYNKLQMLAANNGANGNGNVPGSNILLNQPIEVKISIGSLSGPGQCLLRGGVSKERVELMRLHTAAAAAAAASALLSPTHHLHHHCNNSNTNNHAHHNNNSNSSTRRSSYDKDTPTNNNSNSSVHSTSTSSKSVSNNSNNTRSSKENNAVAANRVVGGKGVLKSSSAMSSLSSKLKPKTSSHVTVSGSTSSSALASLATLAIENPLTFASEICPLQTSSNNNTPKVATTLVSVLGGASGGRRYSFQPPTPPQAHHGLLPPPVDAVHAAMSPCVSENINNNLSVENLPETSVKGLISEIETITPTLMDI